MFASKDLQFASRMIAQAIAPLYTGPIAIAGGSVRDDFLRLTAKDTDVFLVETPGVRLLEIAQLICDTYGGTITNVVSCYEDWTTDLAGVVQITAPVAEAGDFSMDVIMLHRDVLEAYGFNGSEMSFLGAVCQRVDLRLNAVGVGPSCLWKHDEWLEDVREKRLVVQYARASDDPARQQRRLDRLTAPGAKFEGWSKWVEKETGELVPWVSA